MSRTLKRNIFYVQAYDSEDVEFYRVTRSTTNTCEVERLRKTIVFQNEDVQWVEPDLKSSGNLYRCRVIRETEIEFKSGDTGIAWDGKPVKQTCIIYMPMI